MKFFTDNMTTPSGEILIEDLILKPILDYSARAMPYLRLKWPKSIPYV